MFSYTCFFFRFVIWLPLEKKNWATFLLKSQTYPFSLEPKLELWKPERKSCFYTIEKTSSFFSNLTIFIILFLLNILIFFLSDQFQENWLMFLPYWLLTICFFSTDRIVTGGWPISSFLIWLSKFTNISVLCAIIHLCRHKKRSTNFSTSFW